MQSTPQKAPKAPAVAPLLADIPDFMLSMPAIRPMLRDYVTYSLYLEQLQSEEQPALSEAFVDSIRRAVYNLQTEIRAVGMRSFVHFDNSALDEIRRRLIRRTPQGKHYFLSKVPFSRQVAVPGNAPEPVLG